MAAHKKRVEEAEAKGRAAASLLRVSGGQRRKPGKHHLEEWSSQCKMTVIHLP